MLGRSQLYLAREVAIGNGPRTWTDVSFALLQLMDSELSFTVDLSQVGCGCGASVSLVHMNEVPDSIIGSGYCSAQGGDSVKACAEIDLLAGNLKALQSAVYLREGRGADGTCNQDGCLHNWGKQADKNSPYSHGGVHRGAIDSKRPFRVRVTFARSSAEGASLDVHISQGKEGSGSEKHLFDSRADGNTQSG